MAQEVKMNAYTVAYKEHSAADVRKVSFLARNKWDAYSRGFYEIIPMEIGSMPYSAWVTSVTYNNGNHRAFNTFEGKPY